MTEAHSDIADDDAVIDIKTTGGTGLRLTYCNVLNTEDIADIFVLYYFRRIISIGIIAELLYVLLLGFLSFSDSP